MSDWAADDGDQFGPRPPSRPTHPPNESLCKHWQYWLAGWLGWLALPTRSQICWTESGAQRSGIEPLAFTTCYHLLPPQPTPDSPSSRVQTPQRSALLGGCRFDSSGHTSASSLPAPPDKLCPVMADVATAHISCATGPEAGWRIAVPLRKEKDIAGASKLILRLIPPSRRRDAKALNLASVVHCGRCGRRRCR